MRIKTIDITVAQEPRGNDTATLAPAFAGDLPRKIFA